MITQVPTAWANAGSGSSLLPENQLLQVRHTQNGTHLLGKSTDFEASPGQAAGRRPVHDEGRTSAVATRDATQVDNQVVDVDEETLRRGLNFTLVSKLGDLDLLGEIAGGGGFDDLVDESIEIELFGARCLCLGLRKLIDVKRAAGRPKDLEVLAELEEILVRLTPDEAS